LTGLYLDELIFYQSTLTAGNVTTLYAAGAPQRYGPVNYSTYPVWTGLHPTGFASDNRWQVVDGIEASVSSKLTLGVKYNTSDNYAAADPVGGANWYPLSAGAAVEPYRYTWVRLGFEDSTPEKVDSYRFVYSKGYNRLHFNYLDGQTNQWQGAMTPLITMPNIDSVSMSVGRTQGYILATTDNDIRLLRNYSGLTLDGLPLTASGNNYHVSVDKSVKDGHLNYLFTQGNIAMSRLFRIMHGEKVVEDKSAPAATSR